MICAFANCRSQFTPIIYNQRYCRRECNERARTIRRQAAAKAALQPRKCRECPREFMPTRAYQIYCCPECKWQGNRKPGRFGRRLKFTAKLPLIGTPVRCKENVGERKGNCEHHRACLDHATAQAWDGFDCSSCVRYKPVADSAVNYGRRESGLAQMQDWGSGR